MGSKFLKRGIVYLVVIVAMVVLFVVFSGLLPSEEVKTGTMNELISYYEQGDITKFEAEGDYLTGWDADEPGE